MAAETVVVPTPEQLLGECIRRGLCTCEEKLLAAQLLNDGVVPEFPDNVEVVDG